MKATTTDPPRWLLPALLPALLLGLLALSPRTQPGGGGISRLPDRPNILFLLADDQRPDTIGAWGNPHVRTPHLDRLAAEGFSLTGVHCHGSIHGAVCIPSRAMLMSGRSLYRVPMNLEGVDTVPELLARGGYRTFITGKWHNGGESVARIFQEGSSVFLGGMCDHTRVPRRELKDGVLGEPVTTEGFSSELFADAVIDFIGSAKGETPFFAYVAFTAPHDPRQPPEPWRSRALAAPPPLPPNFLPQHPFDNGWLTGRDEKLAPWPRPPRMIRDQLAEYYGLIEHLDAQVGRILAALESSGRAEDTIVIYAADHGLSMGSHGLLGKQSLHDHSMRSPVIVRAPGLRPGRAAALAYLFDLSATFLDVAGVEPPPALEGRSLRPLLEGRAAGHRGRLATFYEDIQRAVRDDRWKLIRYPKVDHEQLFDLREDPHEMVNLAGSPEHAGRQARMREWLEEAQAEFDDPHPLVVAEPGPLEIDLSGRERTPDRWQPEWIVEKYFGGG